MDLESDKAYRQPGESLDFHRVFVVFDFWVDSFFNEDSVPEVEAEDRPKPSGVIRFTAPMLFQHLQNLGLVEEMIRLR